MKQQKDGIKQGLILDQKDIEDLGWKKDEHEHHIEDWYLSGQIQYQNIKIERKYEDMPMGEYVSWRETYFDGKIKNKSELKLVMNLLGILKSCAQFPTS